MKKNELMTTATRTLHRVGFKIKKRSPEILVTAGIVGVVTSAVMACKATTKAGDILAEHEEKMEQIHHVAETTTEEEYSEADLKKDTTIVYTQTAVKFVKLYGPSVAIGAVSIASIVWSNRILTKRNIALSAAYATLDRSFKEYRGRVVDRFGKDLDRELRYNIKAKEVEEVTVDENGNEKTVKKTVDVVDGDVYSEYAKVFDEGCRGWTKDPELNLLFVKQQQNWANERLRSKGYLYLNDVYEAFGFPKTKAGHVIGWIYDPNDPTCNNHVDFGIYDIYTPNPVVNERRGAFINGHERNIIVDFNPDGNIYELLY